MSFIPSNIEERIPAEFRENAERLFATRDTGFAISKESMILAFAQDLGVKEDFLEILHAKDRERAMKRLLGHFRNNVELLIQKTWVEKADEKHKEKLLDRIPLFITDIEGGDIERALRTFIHISEELAYLLFGNQSHKDDFIEYTFRIDPQIGLFWWYTGKLSSLLGSSDAVALYSTLLIGVCFLAAF